VDAIIEEIQGKTLDEIMQEILAESPEGPRLISRDDLLAAGALDVPPEFRKSRGLFDELEDDQAAG
jgi:hypothetical protein